MSRKPVKTVITALFPAVLLGLFLNACASTSYLNVVYQPPATAAVDAGVDTLPLSVVDRRADSALLDPGAQADIPHFSGMFSLSLKKGEQEPVIAGAYDLTGMLRAAFSDKLNAAGIRASEATADSGILLEIAVQEFQLRKVGRKWYATFAYEAAIKKGQQTLTRQQERLQYERLKVIGFKGAEILLGEIVTDGVNRLDMVKLLNHPEL